MIQDIINKLEYDDGELSIECSFPILGDDVLIVFDAVDESSLSEKQIKQLSWAYQNIESMYPEIEKQIYAYYLESSPSYRKGLGNQSNELMPELSQPKDVWNYVSEPGIWIMSDEDANDIHIEYECTFDEENGLRVVINNQAIQRVGR